MNSSLQSQQLQLPQWWWLQAFSLILLVSLAARILLQKPSERRRRQLLKAIPSPPSLPLLGNLHQLGTHAHRSLRSLSERYGHVILVRFGSVPTAVISSAAAAEEVMKTRDLAFASRPTAATALRMVYEGRDVVFAKYGEYWRQVRRVCVLHLLSNKRVQSFGPVREEELALLLRSIRRAAGPVNLSELVSNLTRNVICRVAFGKKYTDPGGGGARFRQVLHESGVLMVAFAMREYIPSLSWVDWLTGLDDRIKKYSSELDALMEKILDGHAAKKKMNDGDRTAAASDFIDILESLEREDGTTSIKLSRESVKAVLLDIYAAGSDTTYTLIEWTMAEIIKHPEEMRRVQEEVRRVVGPKGEVREDMTEKMEYLHAVVKETLRLHPPIPLLIPRESMEDAQIQGHRVPAGTRVMINAWAIGRNPESWGEDPEEWRPARFLGSSIDFKGQDFQLIPFGAGRRGCPGAAFALVTAELVLANLLYHFDWELPEGMKGETLDMAELSGLAVHKKSSLVLEAKPPNQVGTRKNS